MKKHTCPWRIIGPTVAILPVLDACCKRQFEVKNGHCRERTSLIALDVAVPWLLEGEPALSDPGCLRGLCPV